MYKFKKGWNIKRTMSKIKKYNNGTKSIVNFFKNVWYMKTPITTNEQYRNILYQIRTYRLIYDATRSSYYLALYNELIANLYDARANGEFLVITLSCPSVVSLNNENECEIDTNTATLVAA